MTPVRNWQEEVENIWYSQLKSLYYFVQREEENGVEIHISYEHLMLQIQGNNFQALLS